MPLLSSEKQEAFAQHLARGLNGTRAAIEAGYSENGASVRAAELRRKPEIMARVEELRATIDRETASSVVADRRWVIGELISVAKEARLQNDRSNAIRALELVGRDLGCFVNRNMDVTPSAMDGLTTDQLQGLIALAEVMNQPENGSPQVAAVRERIEQIGIHLIVDNDRKADLEVDDLM